jgi:hypothetical protein
VKKPKAHQRKVTHKKPKVTPGPLVVPAPHHKKPAHHPAQQGGKGHHKPKVSGGPVVVPAHPKQARQKKRGLAPGDGWECCSAEALGASLRLAGWPVGDGDVLALHLAAGGSRDTGVSILAALQTAARVGLAGTYPRGFDLIAPEGALNGQRLILGTELPGPHALTVDGPGVWSWGEWHPWENFGDAVIEEAWLIEWEAQ